MRQGGPFKTVQEVDCGRVSRGQPWRGQAAGDKNPEQQHSHQKQRLLADASADT